MCTKDLYTFTNVKGPVCVKETNIKVQRDMYVQQRIMCMRKETCICENIYKSDLYTRTKRPVCTTETCVHAPRDPHKQTYV